MANMFSSSYLIQSSSMAVKVFPFSCRRSTPRKRCFCVVRNGDGNSTQAPKGRGAPQVQIICSLANKVYEDRSKGIACYIDEMGEIVCEGYDEGPRIDTPFLFGHLRDGKIGVDIDVIDLLERSWHQFSNGSRYKSLQEFSTDEFLN